MEHMMLRKGDMVSPVARHHRFKGGTLAIVITIGADLKSPDHLEILWLNGDHRGKKTWVYLDLFEKATERNHA